MTHQQNLSCGESATPTYHISTDIHPFISSKSNSTLDIYTTTHTMKSLHSYITVVTAAALLPINTLALLSSSTTTTRIIRQTSLSTIGSRSPPPSSLPSFTVLESTIETELIKLLSLIYDVDKSIIQSRMVYDPTKQQIRFSFNANI